MREEQFYGGSAQEVEDSRKWQEFLNQSGGLVVRERSGKVILSCRPVMLCDYSCDALAGDRLMHWCRECEGHI